MTFFQAVILGMIQGISEFMPISSSGHTILVPFFLNWHIPEGELFFFNVLVELGTLVAIILYFRQDLLNILSGFVQGLVKKQPFATHDSRLGWLLILATIPAGLAGFFLNDLFEQIYTSPLITGFALLVTAGLLFLAEKVSQKIGDTHDITAGIALFIGLMQTLALVPGISRSGSTISGGMFRHLRREAAGRFAFLMSIPIMAAAGALSTYQMFTEMPNLGAFLPILAAGFLTALVVGYLVIRWLLGFLVNHSLVYFSIYCLLLGSMTIVVWFIK